MKKLLLGIVLCTNVALAKSTGGGNGGDGILCYDEAGNIELAQVLDYYEMENKTLYKNAVKHIKGDYKTKVEFVINKIKMLNEAQGEFVEHYYNFFMKSHKFTSNAELSDIDDSDLTYIELPQSCEMVQAAVQRMDSDKENPKYLISTEIWNLFDETQRAGLVLHEVFYSLYLSYLTDRNLRSADSNHIRKFVRYISSIEFLSESEDLEDFYLYFNNSKFEISAIYNNYFGDEFNVNSFLIERLGTSAEELGYNINDLIGLEVKSGYNYHKYLDELTQNWSYLAENDYQRFILDYTQVKHRQFIIFDRQSNRKVLDEKGYFYDSNENIVAGTKLDFFENNKILIQGNELNDFEVFSNTKRMMKLRVILPEYFWQSPSTSMLDRFKYSNKRNGILKMKFVMSSGETVKIDDIITKKHRSFYIEFDKKEQKVISIKASQNL